MDTGDRHGGLRGFTIVETMIVLAVTGALFVAIGATLGGRQNESEFIHAVQDVQAQIRQVINQVADGFYPNDTNFICTSGSGSGTAPYILPNSTQTQGTNSECIFLGKVIQFGEGSNPEKYEVFTVAANALPSGVQISSSGNPATSQDFKFLKPTVSFKNNSSLGFSSTQSGLEYGLTTQSVQSSGAQIGAIAFLMEIGNLNTSKPTGNGYSNVGQPVDLVPLMTTQLLSSQTSTAIIANINKDLQQGMYIPNPPNGVLICFSSGSTNQSGLVTIGGAGRQLTVNLSIHNNLTCT